MLRNILIIYATQQPLYRQICRNLTSSNKTIAKTANNHVIVQEVESKQVESEYIDWDKELYYLKQEEQRSVLEPPTEGLSDFAPYLKPTFNFAAYVNKSKTLQEFVKLGVNLNKLETIPNVPEFILKLDFDKDVKPRIMYLHGLGVPLDELGKYFTKNPMILKEDPDDLQTRVYYLQYKQFKPDMISRILTKNPYWLTFSTKEIDTRLGYFQKEFKLTGNEIRLLTTKQPKLITYRMSALRENTFSVREEMGFHEDETKILLLKKPRIWMQNRDLLLSKFNYIHNVMKISHQHILEMPDILYSREFIIRQRHSFLKTLNRDQYDRTKENYVSLKNLVEGTDAQFCENVAKTTIQAYNLFLKTL